MLEMNYPVWPFDHWQRPVILDQARLVTITGSAGSGRTHVLVARCFELRRSVGVPAEEMQVLVGSPRAAEQARRVLAEAGGCQVDTVPQFCARLVRQAQDPTFTLLSDRDAAGLLSSFLANDRDVLNEARSSRWSSSRDRAARILASGGSGAKGWERYLRSCEQRELYDQRRIVERAADCLVANPRLAAELRKGPCRWLLADDVHRWGRAERRLLDLLLDDNVHVTLAGDPAQRLDERQDALGWLQWVWGREVSAHHLGLCYRSSGSISDLLQQLSRPRIDWIRPWGEVPSRITGATPVESAAMAAEQVAEWMGRGLDAQDIAVIDLLGGRGIRDMAVHLARVGARRDWGALENVQEGDAMDAAAMLRLALNPRDVVALAQSWRRTDRGARQVAGRFVNQAIAWSLARNRDLLAAADAMLESGRLTERATSWLTDVMACQRALSGCLHRGSGVADALERRRNRVFDSPGTGTASVDFQALAGTVAAAESRGQFRTRLAEILDRRALAERNPVGPEEVEVLEVSKAGGREWRAVCVINAVRPEDDDAAARRMTELYVACSRAKDLLAVCDYRVDHASTPVAPLLEAT